MSNLELTSAETQKIYDKWKDILNWDAVKGDNKINKAILLESQERVHFIKKED